MIDNLLTIEETSRLLNVSKNTLRRWDKDGTLPAVRTNGKHRRYKQEDIDTFLGNEPNELEKTICIYGRVSSHDQKKKGDLDRQCQRLSEYCVKKKYKVGHILKDVGSGLSDLRRGFNKLVELVIAGKINILVIEHKDRLTRFQFNILEKFFISYGVTIECVDKPDKDSEEEFVNDIMMLMASFSGKLYGRIDGRKMMKVIPKLNCDRFDPRFVIADDNGKIMDDAKGWGYKTQEKARKAMWYKFGGGKQKVDDSKEKMKAEVSSLEAKHNGIGKFIEQFDEIWFKEFARGEIDENDLLDAIEEKFGTRLTVYQLECFGET